ADTSSKRSTRVASMASPRIGSPRAEGGSPAGRAALMGTPSAVVIANSVASVGFLRPDSSSESVPLPTPVAFASAPSDMPRALRRSRTRAPTMAGLRPTLLVRDPARLDAAVRERADVVVGDQLRADDVLRATHAPLPVRPPEREDTAPGI